MPMGSQPASMSGMSDDRLGTVAVSLSISELQSTPDVAPVAMDRIARDAVAYPEQFDRRPVRPARPLGPPSSQRSAKRTFSRLAVFGILAFIIVALVLFAASATPNAASSSAIRGVVADDPQAGSGARASGQVRVGLLSPRPAQLVGGRYAVEPGGHVLPVATETT